MIKAGNNSHYCINKGFIVHEHIDEELTVINLEKGHYFIGKGTAIDLFLMLEEPMTVDALTDGILAVYSVPDTVVRDEIMTLIELWLTNGLISEVEGCPETSSTEAATVAGTQPWTQPVFVAFDDMQDLLLLDPIHETHLDQQGWPVSANANESQ